MSAARRCDYCGAVDDPDDEDALLWWAKVGWYGSNAHDACSLDCAHGLIDSLQESQKELQQQWADEAAAQSEMAS